MKRYRTDRRPFRYQQWPYGIIVGVALLYLFVNAVWYVLRTSFEGLSMIFSLIFSLF